MAKVTLPIDKVKEGMQCASNVYTSDDKKILEIGAIITRPIIEMLKQNSITFLSVTEHLVKEEDTIKTEEPSEKEIVSSSPVMEENGIKILKIDSRKAEEDVQKSVEKTKQAYENAQKGEAIDITSIKNDVEQLLQNVIVNKDAYSHLSMLKRKDASMYKHAVDVAILSALTAKELKLPKEDITNIMLGALLHDIGKVLIKDDILNKKIHNEEEKALIQKHPSQGYKLIKKDNLEDTIADIILEHHEYYDGSGYPFKKDNKGISLYSKIVCLCNEFNNLITSGELGIAVSPDKAVKMIVADARKKFDIDVVRAFQKAIGIYPNDTRVKLSDGSIARIIQQNTNLPLRPVVSIARDANGKIPEGLVTVDLAEQKNLFIKDII